MKTKLHGIAGMSSMLIISLFWISSLSVELFGSPETIAWVKRTIVWGMVVLIPMLMATAISGNVLGGSRSEMEVKAKKKRMPFIALNGLFILVPSAILLDRLASTGDFSPLFYWVQAAELLAGAINLTLLGLSAKQGFQMTRKKL